MTDTDRREFTELMQALAASFNRESSVAFLTGYWIGLNDISIQALKTAAAAALQSSKFMPSPAELRELAGVIRAEDRALLAFGYLDKAVRLHGYYHSVDFDDPIMNATINALGGWEKVCDTPDSEFDSFFRKRFIEHYAAYARHGVTAEQAAPCIGYYDRTNGFNGYQSNHLHRIATGLPVVPLLHGQKRIEAPRLRGLPVAENGQPKGIGRILDENT